MAKVCAVVVAFFVSLADCHASVPDTPKRSTYDLCRELGGKR